MSVSLLLALVLAPLSAQNVPLPSEVRHRNKPANALELSEITARGRALAEYDAAAWVATDAVQALKPPADAVEMYLGRRTERGWTFAFGKLNQAKDAFLLAYTTGSGSDSKHPAVQAHAPAEAAADWLAEARAYDKARTAFQERMKPTHSYNGAAMPAGGGEFFVYFYPAQTTAGVYPTGADIRYRLSADGLTIKETHPMHASLMESKVPEGAKEVMSYHTAFLDDAPEDSDVANVLMEGGMPMMIASRQFVYKIDKDGSIAWLGKTKDVLKKEN